MAVGSGSVSGGLKVAPENATFGTPSGSYVDVHLATATMGLRRTLARPVRLSRGAPGHGLGSAVHEYMSAWCDGEIVVPLMMSDAIIGHLYGCGASKATLTYTFGGDEAPNDISMALDVVMDEDTPLSYLFTGVKPTSYRWDFAADQNASLTIGVVGGVLPVKGTSTITRPSDAEIVMPSDVSSFTVGATAIGVKSASITVELPTSSSERHTIGQAFIKQPVRNGPCLITGSLLVDLDDETGFDSVDILDDFLSGTALGDIEFGSSSITASNCLMTGDAPTLGPGITEFPINFEASDLVIVNVT